MGARRVTSVAATGAAVLVGLAILAGCETRAPVTAASAGQPAPTAANSAAANPPSAGQPAFPAPPNPMIGGVAMYPSRDIMDNLAQSPEHHTLVAALNVAGLAATLRQPGPFTVFAPTDAAFRSLPAGMLDQLMQPAGQVRLTALLDAHIINGRYDSMTLGKQVADGNGTTEITTLAGTPLTARLNGAVNLLLRDPAGGFADISIYDVMNANGVIHVIDKVLAPAHAS
jgi:uncharacterized surface protein with fasciclin (FAS1) repeats